MKKIIVANWKLHQSISETSSFLSYLLKELPQKLSNLEVVIAPPYTSLASASHLLVNSSVLLAAQNCFYESRGAFTGEISPDFLRELTCSHIIVGHSERRILFSETDEIIARKILAVSSAGMIPILCIGETLEQRQQNIFKQVLENQLSSVFKIASKVPAKIIIAYEPVWAIGTGKSATFSDIAEVHTFIYEFLSNYLSQEKVASIPILYGGSAKPENTLDIMQQPYVSGLLVGSASLKVDSFIKMIDIIHRIY